MCSHQWKPPIVLERTIVARISRRAFPTAIVLNVHGDCPLLPVRSSDMLRCRMAAHRPTCMRSLDGVVAKAGSALG